MIIENSFEQGDPLWHEARIDSVGGTGLPKIVTAVSNEPSASREAYLLEKAGDIISRDPKPTFQSWEMRWGHKYEPSARELFSFAHGVEVETCAMIFNDDLRRWHISPDFYNEKLRFGGEIKCPQLKEFRKCKKENKLPTKHILQCQAGLALTGFDTWKFMSYFPNLEPFFITVDRDEQLIKIIKVEVKMFLEDLDELINKLRG
jgi:hypothetical protein